MYVKKSSLRWTLALLASALLSGQSMAAETGTDSDWEWGGAVYMWGANMTAVTAGGMESQVPFYKLLDNLEMALMGAVEARKDRWSIFTDIIYMDITAKPNQVKTGPGGNVEFDIQGKVDMESWIITPQVRYAAYESDKSRVSFVGGLRYLDLSMGTNLSVNDQPVFDIGGAADNWDFIMGLHAQFELNDRWFMPVYADVGGGDSKRTYQGMAGIGYRFKRVNVLLTYRYLKYEFDRDEPLLSSLTVKGPKLGVSFGFR